MKPTDYHAVARYLIDPGRVKWGVAEACDRSAIHSIGDRLDTLREDRRKADYDVDRPLAVSTAKSRTAAESVVAQFDKLNVDEVAAQISEYLNRLAGGG